MRPVTENKCCPLWSQNFRKLCIFVCLFLLLETMYVGYATWTGVSMIEAGYKAVLICNTRVPGPVSIACDSNFHLITQVFSCSYQLSIANSLITLCNVKTTTWRLCMYCGYFMTYLNIPHTFFKWPSFTILMAISHSPSPVLFSVILPTCHICSFVKPPTNWQTVQWLVSQLMTYATAWQVLSEAHYIDVAPHPIRYRLNRYWFKKQEEKKKLLQVAINNHYLMEGRTKTFLGKYKMYLSSKKVIVKSI